MATRPNFSFYNFIFVNIFIKTVYFAFFLKMRDKAVPCVFQLKLKTFETRRFHLSFVPHLIIMQNKLEQISI